MKKLFTLSVIAAFTLNVFTQAPQKLSYQAVIRGSSGELVAGKSVGMQISILQGSESGTAVYIERHTISTNANGLATVEIGNGSVVSGNFSAIDWSAAKYYIKTETDPAGGTAFSITGTSQILSVPYALYSKTAKDAEKLILPFSATIAHSDYAFRVINSASSAMNIASTATSGVTFAINAETRSVDNGAAAIRASAATSGAPGTTYGVLGFSQSASGRGIAGITNSLTGQTYGVYGNSYSSEGYGVYGFAGSETGNTTGVYGAAGSPSGTGIYGICFPATGAGYGVRGHVNSPDGYSGYFTGGKFHIAGNTGIGITNPSAKLEVAGQVKITGGTPGAGQVLTSDASGLATWEPIPSPEINHIYFEVKRDESYNWPSIGSVQKIDFSINSSVWENMGGSFNQSTSTFTAPEDGIYSFKGAIYFSNITSGHLIYAYLVAGGKNYNGNWRYASGTSEMVDISMTLFLSKDETAQLWGYVSDPTPPAVVTGNATANFAFTYFSGAKVR